MKNIIIEGGEKMKYENVDRLLQGLVDKGLPGCTLHIAQHGKMLYE